MTTEQMFFLTCLSDFCNGKQTKQPSTEIDIKALFKLAQMHSLAGVIYLQCKPWIESGWNEKGFHNAFLGDVFFSVNRQEMLQALTSRFRNEGISFICMKGSVFRDDWPVPELRSMGDTDLIIRTEDRKKVDNIMISEFGCSKMVDNHAVWTYRYGPLEFEIHDHMFYEYLANRFDYRGYFDAVWNHVFNGTVYGVASDNLFIPDENFHFLYYITHTAKHIINNGVGFRAFLDMVFFTHAQKNKLDWNLLQEELNKLELLKFTKICFALCERWFHVKMPLSMEEMKDDFFKEVTGKICNDGIFGLQNPQNDAAHSAKEIERSRYPYPVAALALSLKKIFPPYRDMQLIPWYAWVDGKPWLMPAAWIYRWGYCLKHKKEKSIALLSEPFNKKGVIENRKHSIQEWGL